jgi:hypothetical protein
MMTNEQKMDKKRNVLADDDMLRMELFLRAREEGRIVWNTKDGRQIDIREMTTSHIANALNMLRRKAGTKRYAEVCTLGGVERKEEHVAAECDATVADIY